MDIAQWEQAAWVIVLTVGILGVSALIALAIESWET